MANLIGEKIARARKSVNLTQGDLAAKVSISAQMVSKWERGESLPDIEMLKSIAAALNVDAAYLISDSNIDMTTKVIDETDKLEDGQSEQQKNYLSLAIGKMQILQV